VANSVNKNYSKINMYQYKPGFLKSNVLNNENNISIIEGSRNYNNKLSLNKSRLVDLLKKNSEVNDSISSKSFFDYKK
jgi:hypothetical protein